MREEGYTNRLLYVTAPLDVVIAAVHVDPLWQERNDFPVNGRSSEDGGSLPRHALRRPAVNVNRPSNDRRSRAEHLDRLESRWGHHLGRRTDWGRRQAVAGVSFVSCQKEEAR